MVRTEARVGELEAELAEAAKGKQELEALLQARPRAEARKHRRRGLLLQRASRRAGAARLAGPQAHLDQLVAAKLEAAELHGKLLEQKSNTYGYDAQTEKFVDFIEAGIVDPTKVVRVALQNAASVAALMITTEAMITDRPDKKVSPPAGMGGGGMGGMDGMDF